MKIGDKVVCVDDSPCKHCGRPLACHKGNIYVINHMYLSNMGKLALCLIGVPVCDHSIGGIAADRFRLLDYLKENAQKQKEEKV